MIPTVLFVLAAWAVTLAAAYCVGKDRGEREGRGEAGGGWRADRARRSRPT